MKTKKKRLHRTLLDGMSARTHRVRFVRSDEKERKTNYRREEEKNRRACEECERKRFMCTILASLASLATSRKFGWESNKTIYPPSRFRISFECIRLWQTMFFLLSFGSSVVASFIFKIKEEQSRHWYSYAMLCPCQSNDRYKYAYTMCV